MAREVAFDLTDQSEHHDQHPDVAGRMATMRRRLFGGLDAAEVGKLVGELEHECRAWEAEVSRLREGIARLETQAAAQADQARLWDERRKWIDDELQQARERVLRMEEQIQSRAERTELEAEQRALAMVDRAAAEAEAILEDAREQAHTYAWQQEHAHQEAQEDVERMAELHHEIGQSIRGAIHRFEQALFELASSRPDITPRPGAAKAGPLPGEPKRPALTVVEPGASARTDAEGSASGHVTDAESATTRSTRPSRRPAPGTTEGDTMSPSKLTVEVYPVSDYPVLSAFERELAQLEAVIDVRVRSFGSGIALLDVELERSAPLGRFIRESMPMGIECDDRRSDHIMVRLLAEGHSTG